jgi:hypothetical protein
MQAGLLGALWGVLPYPGPARRQHPDEHADRVPDAGMIGTGSFALLTLPMAALAYTTPLVVGSLWCC